MQTDIHYLNNYLPKIGTSLVVGPAPVVIIGTSLVVGSAPVVIIWTGEVLLGPVVSAIGDVVDIGLGGWLVGSEINCGILFW